MFYQYKLAVKFNMNNNGIVYLIGAGPGDPGLITVKGIEKIREADVILYDNLANKEFLSQASDKAELIFVGKQAGKHFVKQEKTIEILIQKAKEGKKVVRLKGGDSLIFGRGSEEALELKKEGLPYEIIPGITAGSAASTYAGIPLTHRNLVTQCIFITAHEMPDKPERQVEWKKLAGLKNTNLLIYMGASRLPMIVKTLIENGMDKDMPAAVIENGTLPNQRVLTAKLYEMPDKVKEGGFKPPIIFMIGPTVAIREEMKWIEGKQLYGKKIVVTRAKDQAKSFYSRLNFLGANAIPFPVIKTELARPDNTIKSLFEKKFDWMIFSSENGVRYFFELMKEEKFDARVFHDIKIASIGTGTAEFLEKYNIFADFIPTEFTSEVLVNEMNQAGLIKNNNVLRIKGDFTKDLLYERLIKNNAKVETFEVYKTLQERPEEKVIEDITKNGADYYLFTSISTVNNFFEVLGENKAKELLNKSKVVAIGPVTAERLKELEIKRILISDIHTIAGMTDTLLLDN